MLSLERGFTHGANPLAPRLPVTVTASEVRRSVAANALRALRGLSQLHS